MVLAMVAVTEGEAGSVGLSRAASDSDGDAVPVADASGVREFVGDAVGERDTRGK